VEPKNNKQNEQRELRYKLVEDDVTVASGTGRTIDLGSGGLSFEASQAFQPGARVEISISWPVLLDDTCAMRLVIFGRVLRSVGSKHACMIEKYQFRTQARALGAGAGRSGAMGGEGMGGGATGGGAMGAGQMPESFRKETVKTKSAGA